MSFGIDKLQSSCMDGSPVPWVKALKVHRLDVEPTVLHQEELSNAIAFNTYGVRTICRCFITTISIGCCAVGMATPWTANVITCSVLHVLIAFLLNAQSLSLR